MNAILPILILLVVYLVVFAEASFGGVRHFLGAQIDLLPALMVYTSLSAGLVTIILVALCGGLFFDSLSANPFGVSVLPLLLIGAAIYSQRGLILRDQTFAQFILGLSASAAMPLLTLLWLLSKGQKPLLGWFSLWQWIVMTVGGGILTPVVFRFFGLLERALVYRPATQTTFRSDREIERGRKL
jgi:hypothetical protein